MRNLEFKARFDDLGRAEQIARGIGAASGGELHQSDTFFLVPRGRLKLRMINETQGELIFYERPELTATRWSDFYVAPVADSDAMRDLLHRALGVRVEVQKLRRLYWYRGARIHLDAVRALGTFVEFEVPVAPAANSTAPPDHDEAQPEAIMRELMHAYGLSDSDAICASYAELLERL